MAKAHLTLPNGTQVTIEGTPDEVRRLLDRTTGKPPEPKEPLKGGKAARRPAVKADVEDSGHPDLTQIVNLVKDCDEADAIERNILDRTSIVDRVLLPLYIVKKYAGASDGLTSGEISKITIELGVPVATSNTPTALSGAASKYVMGDKVRRKGQPVRYRLSRRGEQYLADVIRGKAGEE
jgi:hypothetical protein